MKRVLSLIIILLLVAPSAMGTVFIDTIDTNFDIAAQVLCGLGIMNSYSDGTFRGDIEVTRGEFADILVKLLNNPTVISEPEFNDVSAENEYSQSIGIVNAYGIMSGDGNGNFRPDSIIGYNEAVKALISILGYDTLAEYEGGYPVGYLAQASKTGLMSGIKSSDILNRGVVARLIFNATDIDVLNATSFGAQNKFDTVDGENILYIYHNITKVKGRVNSDGKTSIGASEAIKGFVDINGKIYEIGTSNAGKYLGMYVTAYVFDEEEDGTVVFISDSLSRGESITLSAEDIVSADFSSYTYYSLTKRITVQLDDSFSLIYNRRAVKTFDESLLVPEVGQARLVDGNGNGTYDTVFIEEWDIYIVDSVNQDRNLIFDKYGKGTLEIRDNDEIYKDGRKISLGNLRKWDFAAVLRSLDGQITILTSSEKTEGRVTSIGGDTAVIEGREYVFSDIIMPSPKVGYEGTYILGVDGVIYAYDLDTFDGRYAWLFQASRMAGLAGTVQIKVLDDDGEFNVYNISNPVKVNNIFYRSNAELLQNTLLFSGEKAVNRLIMYNTNASGEINEIFTANDSTGYGIDAENFSLDYVYKDSSKSYRIYRKYIGLNYLINNSTKVFLIPDSTDPSRLTNEDEYEAGSGAILPTDVLYNEFNIFDSSKERIPGAFVAYTEPVTATSTLSEDLQKRDVALVEKNIQRVNSDGSETRVISLNVKGNNLLVEAKNLEVSNKIQGNWNYPLMTVRNIKPGDAIQYSVDSSGKMTSFLILFRGYEFQNASVETLPGTSSFTSTFVPLSYLHTLYGEVMDISGSTISVNSEGVLGEAGVPAHFRHYIIGATTYIYIYDSGLRRVTAASRGDIMLGDMVFVRDYNYTPLTIFIYR